MSAGLVDRGDEIAVLDGLLDALARDGTGAACLVTGPVGIGKSSLVAAALERARADLTVLRARGAELESNLSFGAVRDLFTGHVQRLTTVERDRLLTGPAGLARPVLGLGTEEVGDPLYGLFWLSAAIAEVRPLVLAVDDLHWLDPESARFCGYLARRLEGLPVALLATARPSEPGTDAAVVDDLSAVARVIELGPLTPDGVAAIVAGPPAAEVHRITGGNPLLAVELARTLELAGPDADLDAVAPDGVGMAILRRVGRVSPDAVALSRAVALSPRPLTMAEAAALADLTEDQVVAAADALVRAAVFEWTGERMTFLHPLMRTAVYDELAPVARRAAHARAARVLSGLRADVDVVAGHLLASEPCQDDEAVRVLVAAADLAAARQAPRAAARYLERAVAEPPSDVGEQARLRHRLGRVQMTLGRREAAATLAAARSIASRDDAGLTVDFALALLADGRAEEAADALAPHLVATPVSDDELDVTTAYVLAVIAGMSESPARVPGVALASGIAGSTPAQRRALCVLSYAGRIAGAPAAEVRPLVLRALGEIGDQIWVEVVTIRASLLADVGLFEERERLAVEQRDAARRAGADALYVGAQLELAVIDNQRGRLREAEATIRLALESPGVSANARASLEDWLVTTLSMQGRFDEAEALLAEMVARAGSVWRGVLQRRRAEIALDRGDFAAAVEPAGRAVEAFAGRAPFSDIGCGLAVALAALGRRDEAESIARQMLAAARAGDSPQLIGIALWALGSVLGGEEGLVLLEESLAVLAASPFRWNQATTELALGSALRRAGQRARAREVLASALAYAVENGAAPIEGAAREELRLCGARPRRAAVVGVAALTPAEERIARLAADGLSNKEIAQQLFVTVKNVEMHLVHAYRKLGIGSRRELAAVLSPVPEAAG